MRSINPKELTIVELQAYLQGVVGPRPIAFASTISATGVPNLSPFSFFNVFSANPPILIFSPARRVRDNTIKHTLQNAEATKEVVINIVNHAIVQQMSLSSTEYPENTNEFLKSGLTAIPSELVKPYRVAESPVQLECVVQRIIPLGAQGGAGNLIVCEVVKMHFHESIIDSKGQIDQVKIDLVGRMGGNWYSRANMGLFEVPKPIATLGIGVDTIPDFIKHNALLDGNDLGKLGNIEALPNPIEIDTFVQDNVVAKELLRTANEVKIVAEAKILLAKNQILEAWCLLLAFQKI